jgi:hypothetical protein
MKNHSLSFAFPQPQFANTGFAASTFHNPALPLSALDDNDLIEQLHMADRADWLLLRLVGCTALATLLLAAAISLGH